MAPDTPLSEEAYKRLRRRQRPGESLSDTVARLTAKEENTWVFLPPGLRTHRR